MGYIEIENLYKDTRILMFKECWATEKIHGTSAWITYKGEEQPEKLLFHPGGAKMEMFVALFDEQKLLAKMIEIFGNKTVRLHGEHYGGSIQKMKTTYGDKNKFVMFDVLVGTSWLSFDKVLALGKTLELDVVDGHIIPATVEALNQMRDMHSVQAIKNGIIEVRMREGIVIRPLIELRDNNGRVITKHKRDQFMETKTAREVSSEKLKLLTDAEAIADEWVTPMRLLHVLDSIDFIGECDISKTGIIITAMNIDVEKESKGETVITQEVKKAIGKKTSQLFREYLQKQLNSQ
jgi:hypothetical protein